MAIAHSVEIFLITQIIKADAENKPMSTWELAKRCTKDKKEIAHLDGVFRYYLEKLAKDGILVKKVRKRNGKKSTCYSINPERVVFARNAWWILTNPVTIIGCPYADECEHEKTPLEKCRLYQEAPEPVKKWIAEHYGT